jgi:hypothetical protein
MATDYFCEDSTRDPTTGDLTDDATNIWRRCISEERKQHIEDLSSNTAAMGFPSVPRSNILGCASDDISAGVKPSSLRLSWSLLGTRTN